MESKVNYTIVGLFVLILLAAIIIIALWLSTGVEQRNYKTYLVYMNESVAGLSQQAPVKYNGVNVGFVKNIELNLENPQQVILTLSIEPEIPITESTEAVLTEQGITGIAYIGLQGGDHAPALKAKPGQEYPVIKAVPSFLVRLDTTLQNLSTNVDSLTSNVKRLFNDENIDNLQNTIKNVDEITSTIAKNSKQIDAGIKNLDTFMQNTAKASKEFPEVIASIQKGAKSIDSLSSQITRTTKNIDKAVTGGDEAIHEFSDQLMPQAYGTFQNLHEITDNMRELSEELKQNPSILIRGKKAPQPGPGEK